MNPPRPPPLPPGHPPPPQAPIPMIHQHVMGMDAMRHFPPPGPPPPGPPPPGGPPPPNHFPHHPPGQPPTVPPPPPGAPIPQQVAEPSLAPQPKKPIIFTGHVRKEPSSLDEDSEEGKNKRGSNKKGGKLKELSGDKQQEKEKVNDKKYISELYFGAKAQRIEGIHIVPFGLALPGLAFTGKTKPDMQHRSFTFIMYGRNVETAEIIQLLDLSVRGGVQWMPLDDQLQNVVVDYLAIDGDFDEVSLLIHGEEDKKISRELERDPFRLPPYPNHWNYMFLSSSDIDPFMEKLQHSETKIATSAEIGEVKRNADFEKKLLSDQLNNKNEFSELFHEIVRQNELDKEQVSSLQLLIGRLSVRHDSALVSLETLADLVEEVFSLPSNEATSISDLITVANHLEKLNEALSRCWTVSSENTLSSIDKRGIMRDMIGEDGASLVCQTVVKLLRDVFDFDEFSSQAEVVRSLSDADRKNVTNYLEPAIIRCVRLLLVNEFTATEFANAGGCEALFKLFQQFQVYTNSFKQELVNCLIEAMDKLDFPRQLHLISDNTDSYQSMLYVMACLKVSSALTPSITLLINMTTLIGHLIDWKAMVENTLSFEIPKLLEAIRDLCVENEKMTTAVTEQSMDDDEDLGFSSSDFFKLAKKQESPSYVSITQLLEWRYLVTQSLEKVNNAWVNTNSAFKAAYVDHAENSVEIELKREEMMINILSNFKFVPCMTSLLGFANLLEEFIELVDWSIHPESYQIRSLLSELYNHLNEWSDRLRSSRQFPMLLLKNISCFQAIGKHYYLSRGASLCTAKGGLGALVADSEALRFSLISLDKIFTQLNKAKTAPAQDNHLKSDDLVLLRMISTASSARELWSASQNGLSSAYTVLSLFGVEIASSIHLHIEKLVNAASFVSPSEGSSDVISGSGIIIHYLLKLLHTLLLELSSPDSISLTRSLLAISKDGLRLSIEMAHDLLLSNQSEEEFGERKAKTTAINYISAADLDDLKNIVFLLASLEHDTEADLQSNNVDENAVEHIFRVLDRSRKGLAISIPSDLKTPLECTILLQKWSKSFDSLENACRSQILPNIKTSLNLSHFQVWSFVQNEIAGVLQKVDAVITILIQRIQCEFGQWRSSFLNDKEVDGIVKNSNNISDLLKMLQSCLKAVHFLTSWCCQQDLLSTCAENPAALINGSAIYAKMYMTFSSSVFKFQLVSFNGEVFSIQEHLIQMLRMAASAMLTVRLSSNQILGLDQTFPSYMSELMATHSFWGRMTCLELFVRIFENFGLQGPSSGLVQRWSQFSDDNVLEPLGTLLSVSIKYLLLADHSTNENDLLSNDQKINSTAVIAIRLIQCISDIEGLNGPLTIQITKVIIFEIMAHLGNLSAIQADASKEGESRKEEDIQAMAALQGVRSLNIISILRVIEKEFQRRPVLIVPFINSGLLGVIKMLLSSSTSIPTAEGAGLALVAIQVLTTIYHKLESMRVYLTSSLSSDAKNTSSSSYSISKEKDSLTIALSLVAVLILECVPPLLLKYQDSVTFLQQAVVSIHALPAETFLEKFFIILSSVGHGFSLEFLAIKLWIAFEEGMQYLSETTDIRKQVMMFTATAFEGEEAPFTEEESNQLLLEAHSQFTLSVVALKSILEIILWGYEAQKIGLSVVSKALRTGLADPKKVLIRFQKGYTMWMIGFVHLVEQVTDQLTQEKRNHRRSPIGSFGSTSSSASLFTKAEEQEEFNSRHLLISSLMKILVDISSKAARYQASKEEKIRLPLVKSTIAGVDGSTANFDERWDRLKQCELMDQEIKEENDQKLNGEEEFAFDEGFDELEDGTAVLPTKSANSNGDTPKQYVPMKPIVEVHSLDNKEARKLLIHISQILSKSSIDADNLIHFDFRQQHFNSWNGVDTTFKEVVVETTEVLQALHGINQPFNESPCDSENAKKDTGKNIKRNLEVEDVSKQKEMETGDDSGVGESKESASDNKKDDDKTMEIVVPIEEKSLLRLIKRRRLAQIALPESSVKELDETLFKRLTEVPELPPPIIQQIPLEMQHTMGAPSDLQFDVDMSGKPVHSSIMGQHGMNFDVGSTSGTGMMAGDSSGAALFAQNPNNTSAMDSSNPLELLQMLLQAHEQGQLGPEEEMMLMSILNNPQQMQQLQQLQQMQSMDGGNIDSIGTDYMPQSQPPPIMHVPPPPPMLTPSDSMPPSFQQPFRNVGGRFSDSGKGGRGGRGHYQQNNMGIDSEDFSLQHFDQSQDQRGRGGYGRGRGRGGDNNYYQNGNGGRGSGRGGFGGGNFYQQRQSQDQQSHYGPNNEMNHMSMGGYGNDGFQVADIGFGMNSSGAMPMMGMEMGNLDMDLQGHQQGSYMGQPQEQIQHRRPNSRFHS